MGLLSPGTHSCPRWWATWTPWHPTPPGRPAPPWQQGPYLGCPLGPELPAAGRCLPLAQEAALPSGKKEKKGTEKKTSVLFSPSRFSRRLLVGVVLPLWAHSLLPLAAYSLVWRRGTHTRARPVGSGVRGAGLSTSLISGPAVS